MLMDSKVLRFAISCLMSTPPPEGKNHGEPLWTA